MQHVQTPSLQKRATAIITAGMVCGCLLLTPMVAFAATPSAGTQTGTGTTDVTVVVDDAEMGGTIDPANPDTNNDGIGDNIAFTVPASINFVAAADGTLTGPSATSAYIENLSGFGIRASSFDVDAENEWTIIENDSTASAANSVDFQFGPQADSLDAYDYLSKTDVATPSAWNMAAGTDSGTVDRVQMSTAGNLFKVDKDITTASKIATIKTYIKAGNAS